MTLAVSILQAQTSIGKLWLRHIEGLERYIGSDIEAAIMLLDIVAILVLKYAEVHGMSLDRAPWRVDYLGLKRRVLRQGKLHLRVDKAT